MQEVLTEDTAVKKIQAAWRGYKVLSMNSPVSVYVVCGDVGQEDVQLLSETDQLQTKRGPCSPLENHQPFRGPSGSCDLYQWLLSIIMLWFDCHSHRQGYWIRPLAAV